MLDLDWTDVRILYVKELRAALRERTIVVNSVLLPILLYPAMLWIMLTGLTFVMGLAEGFVSRIALQDVPAAHEEVRERLAEMESVELVEVDSDEAALARIREGALDALVRFSPATGSAGALADNVRVQIAYDRSEERSNRAQQRIEGVLERYREEWLETETTRLGVSAEELEQFRVVSRNVATSEEMGALVLGSMVPLFLVVMVALGCLVPAVDSTAGERERQTWETTMSIAASRTSIITAKYLYVATLGMVAGTLNVIAVTVSLGPIFQGMTGTSEQFTFTIAPSAFPVMVLGAGLMALFFAAAMMILAAFARTFKDGQAMVMPVYWLALIPLVLGNSPDQHLTPGIAAIPVANVAMMIRDAIVGSFQPLLILEVLVVGLIMVSACLWVAGRVLRFEDLLVGSYDGSFWQFAKEHLIGNKKEKAP